MLDATSHMGGLYSVQRKVAVGREGTESMYAGVCFSGKGVGTDNMGLGGTGGLVPGIWAVRDWWIGPSGRVHEVTAD